MYLWQRLAAVSWWNRNGHQIRAEAGDDLVVVERPGRKRMILEIACRSHTRANALKQHFGGGITKLPRDWLVRFSREQKTRPLRIGDRLVIRNVGGTSWHRPLADGPSRTGIPSASRRGHLIIPAGAAFGTGQHPTTAMSLRILEQLTRKWKPGWSMVDLGTGSGIFALAARRLGANRVMGIDIDPVAISTAKANAALNKIPHVQFRVADVVSWRMPQQIDVVTANLFSELLIQIIPKLKAAGWLIISGVMREQERGVINALKRSGFKIQTMRRRGKWIVALCAFRGARF